MQYEYTQIQCVCVSLKSVALNELRALYEIYITYPLRALLKNINLFILNRSNAPIYVKL